MSYSGTSRSKGRLVNGSQEGFALCGSETVLAFVSHSLIATVMGALDGSPFDLAGLAGNGGAFLGGIVLGSGLRTE